MGRTELTVGGGHGRHRRASSARGPRPTWSGSGNRSGSRSAIWTWSTSRKTWMTSSWTARKSALGFWICSETARGRCRERPCERHARTFQKTPGGRVWVQSCPFPSEDPAPRRAAEHARHKPLLGWRLSFNWGLPGKPTLGPSRGRTDLPLPVRGDRTARGLTGWWVCQGV